MGVILKLALRNMKRRKLRYILTTITLVISVALFGGVLIVSDSFNEMLLNTFDEQLGTADILIRTVNSTDSWFDPDEIDIEIRNIDHVESVAYRISGFNLYVSAINNGTLLDNSTSTGIYGINPQNEDEQKLGGAPYIIDSISSGDTIEELLDYNHEITRDRVVVISESLKIQLGGNFTVNKSIWIYPNEGDSKGCIQANTGTWIEYTVVAIIRDISEARDFDPESASTTSMISLSIGPGIFANINNTHELVDGTENHTGEYTLGVVGIDDLYRISSVVEDIQNELIDPIDDKDWVLNDLKSDSIEQIDISMSIVRTMFTLFGLIALILSIILMMNIFNIIKKEQEYETGMFQAIGASKSETFKMFLSQGIVMGIIGTSIGTLFSYLISYIIMSVSFQTATDITSHFEGITISEFEIILYPTTIIITLIIGFISCVLASLYPSWKASRKPIIECLNPIEEKSKREKKHYWKKIIFFILAGLLILFGYMLMNVATDIRIGDQSDIEAPGAGNMVLGMFGPIFILFGIIWLMVLCIKPLNKIFVFFFSPYLQKTRLLTEKNILRHRRRTALTFTLITLTTSFLIGISVMMESMKSGVNTTIDGFMGSDIRLITYGTPKSYEEGLLNQSGVDDVMGINYQNAQVQIENELVGHSQLDSEWNKTITINVLDTTKAKDHLTKSKIVSPTTMTFSEMMDEIKEGNNIIIDEQFADDYDVKVGDQLPINFSLGINYANLSAFLDANDYKANEVTLVVNMTVVAIVSNIQGFLNLDLFGTSEGKTYNMYISWEVYKEIASKNLPGGGTDMVFRQLTQTGNSELDAIQPNWFNFSTIETILNSITGIEYYTTRMDYYSPTAFNGIPIDYMSSITGIHINSSGTLRSDSYFGNNSVVAQKVGYSGDTMEELLNTTQNVCVVDEIFMMNNPSIAIGDNISIFPQQFVPTIINAGTFPFISTIIPYLANYTSISGSTGNLTLSDDVYLSIESNQQWLAFNITTSLLTPNFYKAINVTIETSLNTSVEKLDLEVLNVYTNSFEKLGSINNSTEANNTFYFDINHNYIDQMNNINLRVVGYNSTYNSNYNLTIDSLRFGLLRSVYSTTDSSTWPTFEIVGIIEAPTLYNAERYNWDASYESAYDVVGTNGSIYVSYEKARNIIYEDYKGSIYSDDKVTSVLVHCEHPFNITMSKYILQQSLSSPLVEGNWSIVDIKFLQLYIRTNVYDWFVWVDDGVSDEMVLQEVAEYLNNNGFVIIYSFTKSFLSSMFKTMLNLITFITNGLLFLCIIIAMIGLTLHSLLTTMARRREIGMLRSIGLNKKGVIRSISGETLILALLGLFGGIFAGLTLGSLMVTSIPSGGFLSVTWTIPWLVIGILVLTVLVTVILSSRYPSKWAANLNIIDAVRTR